LRAALDIARGRGVRLSVAPAALPAAAAPPQLPAPATPSAPGSRPRALFISGEDHTPGTIYRVDRYLAAATACGFDARAMTAAPVGPPDLENISLVVLWRVPYSNHIQGVIDMARQQGGRVIFDVDDLMFRPEMAVIDIIDGIRSQKFSELETQAFFTLIGRTLKACDLVTCPTAELAHHARRMGRPAYVLPNGFDDASHATARRARREWATVADDLLRIGYAAGSRTHQRDFAVAVPAILRVLRENDRARLVLFRDPNGGEGVVLINEFPEFAALADRIEWRDMVKLPDLPKELARFTINIAPLEPGNPFCEAKSELKYFEAALAGVPTIASPAGPFKRAIIHGATGFIAETEDDWHAALTTLLNDAALRTRIATAAYHDSLAHFGPHARAQSFALMLAQIDGGRAGAAAFERECHRASMPRLHPPHVPAADILFAQDRMQDADVTVIVPVYNYADYVPETLASIAAQTLAPLDLVIIDDASPDDSHHMVLDWLKANAPRFNRVSFLRHRKNAGLGFARNSGFATADTPYVLPLDADNRLRPEACATLLAKLSATDAAFAYPAIQQFGDASDIFGTEPYSVLRLQRGNYIDAMALVRKSAWAAAGGYDHVQYGWEDYDLWCRLAERGQYGIAVPDILADYRVHKQSMLHTMTEIRDHKGDLIADIKRRHPWLDVSKKAE
jgi:glycosyltransferase involved in cell wall biosynthesis